MRREEIFRIAGRELSPEEMALIREVVESCGGLSRTELANTVCELLDWRRSNGSLKGVECRELLDQMGSCGYLVLPAKQKRRPLGSRTRVPVTRRGDAPSKSLEGSVREFRPLAVEPVEEPEQRLLFRELVGRYHYLGHTVPYGAHLRYLVWASKPQRVVVGCLQFSSPAWRMSVRDRWIGWNDATRRRNLQRVVNNSRFLILPWVQIRNMASTVLSQATQRLAADWRDRYAVEPLLVETLVDGEHFSGTCYRAANWIALGVTAGRGRMDRKHQRHGLAPKMVLVYPLVRNAAQQLRETQGSR
jgi:hypothetical protein